MFKVDKPDKPLDSQIFHNETGFDLFMIEGDLYVSGCRTVKEAEEALEAHNPPIPRELSIEEKLASVGLKIDDLKQALGL